MRIVIQDPANKAYFTRGGWSTDLEQAIRFENVAQAEAFCGEHELSEAMIVLKFKDPLSETSYLVAPGNKPKLYKVGVKGPRRF